MGTAEALRAHAMAATDAEARQRFLDSPAVFWVDWRDAESAVVEACAGASGVNVAVETAPDSLQLAANQQVIVTALNGGTEDRHATLLALNEVLSGSHEIRLALASLGADSLAFAVLPEGEWSMLDDDLGDAVAQVVWRLDEQIDPFGDLQDLGVLSSYLDHLEEHPGRYGDSLAYGLAHPLEVSFEDDDAGPDSRPVLEW